MDDHRFDQLARSLAAETSRRAVLKRLAGTVVGATLGLGGRRRVGAQDAEIDDTDVQVGTGGHADGGSGGGSVATGDISTGGNRGNVTTIGDVASGDGDATVVVDGGEVTTSTDIALSADGGSTTVSADGGDNNTVTVTAEGQAPPPSPPSPPTPPPPPPINVCAGVTCPVCQACNPATGTCAAVVCPPAANECFVAGTCAPLTGLCSPPVYRGEGATCSAGVCFNQACCTPRPDADFCTGMGGTATNNCGQTVVCDCTGLPLNAPCVTADQCCPDGAAVACGPVDNLGQPECCRPLGAACATPGGFNECCATLIRDNTGAVVNGRLVICASGTCGGVGARCDPFVDTCAPGLVCNADFGPFGPFGQCAIPVA